MLSRRTSGSRALDYELFLRLFPKARTVRHVSVEVARAVYHQDAKSIRGMRKQIVEFMQVKHRYATKLALTPTPAREAVRRDQSTRNHQDHLNGA